MSIRTSWRAIAVTLVVAGLLVVAGQRASVWSEQRDRLADDKAVVAAAQAEVERLIDISSSTSEEDMSRLLDGATADFRKELEAQTARLRKALADNAVQATGEAVSSGVVKLDGDRATVIVAAVGTVRNKQTEKPEPRNYRLRANLLRSGDAWLVSGLEFVA